MRHVKAFKIYMAANVAAVMLSLHAWPDKSETNVHVQYTQTILCVCRKTYITNLSMYSTDRQKAIQYHF